MNNSRKRCINIFVNALVCCVSILAALLCLDLLLHFVKPQPGLGEPADLYVRDQRIGFRLKPNFHGKVKEREYATTITVNKNGFRQNRDYSYEKPLGVKRMVVLGDSFAAGAGVNNGESFVDKIQSDMGSKYEILNMGVGGHGTVNEVAYLRYCGLQYHPDIVVLAMFLGNDITDNNSRIAHANNTTKKTIANYRVAIIDAIRPILRESYVIQFISSRICALMTAIHLRGYHGGKMDYDYMMVKNTAPGIQSGFKYTASDLQELKRICDERGTQLRVVLIPFRDQVIDSRWDNIKAYQHFYERDKPQRIISEILKSLSINYFDLLPSMRMQSDKNRFYYVIDPHCTVRGYQFIGKAISDYIKETLV